MTPKLIVASTTDSLQDCVDVMAAKDIRHLPVAGSDGDVVGLISIKDIALSLSKERSAAIKNLQKLKTEKSMPIHDG